VDLFPHRERCRGGIGEAAAGTRLPTVLPIPANPQMFALFDAEWARVNTVPSLRDLQSPMPTIERPVFMKRFPIAALTAVMAVPSMASAQVRVSVGAGAGIAASTDGTLSDGRTGPVVTGQVTTAGSIGVGLEADGWWGDRSSVLLGTAHLQFHVPATSLLLTLGAGVGRGDPDQLGTISGVAGHIGAAFDIGTHASSLALTLFGNGFLVYAPARSLQMVEAGLAITRRP
jgi:hypothetical protein